MGTVELTDEDVYPAPYSSEPVKLRVCDTVERCSLSGHSEAMSAFSSSATEDPPTSWRAHTLPEPMFFPALAAVRLKGSLH